jgi:ketosteroid isomerase-like protein
MDTIMAAQEHVALARSLLDLYNSRQSDPAWLDKGVAAFAADCEIIDVPSGAILRGLDGYKRIVLFFAESLPASRVELTNAFATEDQVVLEGTSRWTNTGPLQLPSGALPATERSGEVRFCYVLQIRHGKIVRFHTYYDMMTMLEQRGLAPVTGQATE